MVFLWVHCRWRAKQAHLRRQLRYRHWVDFQAISKILDLTWFVGRFRTFWAHTRLLFFWHRDPHPWVHFLKGRADTQLYLWFGCSPSFWLLKHAKRDLFYRLRPKSKLSYFSESVDSEDGKVWVSFCIAHNVKIDEFFELKRRGCDIFEYIHKQRWDVFAVGHVGDDTSNGLLFLVDVYTIKLLFEFSNFSGFSLLLIFRCHIF